MAVGMREWAAGVEGAPSGNLPFHILSGTRSFATICQPALPGYRDVLRPSRFSGDFRKAR